ncbi:hypothetical protein GCM10027062_30410 [Nocardioides hungaricus]
MNTHPRYERRLDRVIPEPAPAGDAETSVDALAVHRDPSAPIGQGRPEADRSLPSVAWVRPSEMPTLLGSRFVRRGIDLQAELTRRARRAPGAAISKAGLHRITRTSIARPDTAPSVPGPIITDQEGPGL